MRFILSQKRKMTIAGAFVIFLLVLDHLIKWWAVSALSERSSSLIGTWLHLTLAYNENIAFSLPLPPYIALPAVVVIIGALAYVLWQRAHVRFNLEAFGLLIIITGALGNLIDRLRWGAVVDYVQLPYSYWPIFNLADVLVSVGVVLVIITLFRERQ